MRLVTMERFTTSRTGRGHWSDERRPARGKQKPHAQSGGDRRAGLFVWRNAGSAGSHIPLAEIALFQWPWPESNVALQTFQGLRQEISQNARIFPIWNVSLGQSSPEISPVTCTPPSLSGSTTTFCEVTAVRRVGDQGLPAGFFRQESADLTLITSNATASTAITLRLEESEPPDDDSDEETVASFEVGLACGEA